MIVRLTKICILLAIALSLLPGAVAMGQTGTEKASSETNGPLDSSIPKTNAKAKKKLGLVPFQLKQANGKGKNVPVEAGHVDHREDPQIVGMALAEATRVSTAEAARNAAKRVSKKQADADAAADSRRPDVLEFRPANPHAEAAGGVTLTRSKDARKSGLKDVHGTAYGSADLRKPANREGAVSVGATSKSGQSSIYVETDRSRAASSQPH